MQYAVPRISDKNYLRGGSGICALEAYHAGAVRVQLLQNSSTIIEPWGADTLTITQVLSVHLGSGALTVQFDCSLARVLTRGVRETTAIGQFDQQYIPDQVAWQRKAFSACIVCGFRTCSHAPDVPSQHSFTLPKHRRETCTHFPRPLQAKAFMRDLVWSTASRRKYRRCGLRHPTHTTTLAYPWSMAVPRSSTAMRTRWCRAAPLRRCRCQQRTCQQTSAFSTDCAASGPVQMPIRPLPPC